MSTALRKLDWSVIRESYNQVLAKIESEGMEFSPDTDELDAFDDEFGAIEMELAPELSEIKDWH